MDLAWLNENEFYRAMVDRDITQLSNCPVLDKASYNTGINHCFKKYGSRGKFWQSVYWSPTGGSTSSESKSMYFPCDIEENRLQRHLLSQYLKDKHTGVFSECNLIANLFSSTHMYRSLELVNELASNAGITSLPIGSNCSNDAIHEFIQYFKPDMIAGPPIVIAHYASYCIQYGLELDIKSILYGTNPLFPAQEKMIAEAFNHPKVYSLYGSAETGIWAYHNPEVLLKNQFIVVDEVANIEILNQNDEGFGNVVITNKIRRRFPVIRYALGDIGKVSKHCINKKLYNIVEIKGRNSSWLTYADYRIEISKINNLLKEYLDWQIIQYFEHGSNTEVIDLRILSGGTDQDESYLKKAFEELLLMYLYKGELKLIIQFVDLKDLIKSKISQKVIKIIDKRNLPTS